MKRLPGILVLMLALAWVVPAPAQLFAKKPKVNPSQRVPELILVVKTDADERKRARAAEELRDYDVDIFVEIVPVLVDVLRTDKKANVRFEALTSLIKIRPVSNLAGQAIEKAAAEDESWRVRLHAKTALPKYHLAGYPAKKSEQTVMKPKATIEPPVATPAPPAPPPTVSPLPRPLPPSVSPPMPKSTPAPTEQGPSLFPK